MTLVNLNPHPVTVIHEHGVVLAVLPAAKRPARATMVREAAGSALVDEVEVPIWRSRLGTLEDLPGPTAGVCYVVSRVVVDAAARAGAARDDLLVPDDLVRDADGAVVACRGFALVS